MRVLLIAAAILLCCVQPADAGKQIQIAAVDLGAQASMQMDQQLEAMEQKFFEHDFSKESANYRIERLEKFAFGQTSSGSLDARLQRLSGIIDLHPNLMATAPDAQPTTTTAASDADPDDSGEPARYPHITTLEQQILGQTFETDSLNNRLSRLETKAFGKATSANPDSAARTDALQEYAEKKLHKAPYDVNRATNSDQSNKSLKWVEDYRPAPRIVEPMQSILGGLLGIPMHEEPEQQAAAPAPAAPPQDPAIFQESPPDSHARMLTRVGWCEQHLFGHTFPNLHLTERLHQLNTELFPTDREPDIKLMDRVDVIVKEVVMRQHPPIAFKQ